VQSPPKCEKRLAVRLIRYCIVFLGGMMAHLSHHRDKAVVLLSGGLDSTTALAIAHQDYDCYTLSFDYGQKCIAELKAAQKISQAFDVVAHKLFKLPINCLFKGSSALMDGAIAVPEYVDNKEDIPITYVPARNTIFLSIALGWAEVIGANAIFIGVSQIDYSGYPDCRQEYIKSFQAMVQ